MKRSKHSLESIFGHIDPSERRLASKYKIRLVQRMREVLEEKGMTQADLSRKTGWDASTVSRMLSGARNMTFETLAKFETAVDKDVVYIRKRDSADVFDLRKNETWRSSSAPNLTMASREVFSKVEIHPNDTVPVAQATPLESQA
jgi:transcriptional regulator with XRE-family HTH domain